MSINKNNKSAPSATHGTSKAHEFAPPARKYALAGKSAPSATHTTRAHEFEPSKNNKSHDTRPEPSKNNKSHDTRPEPTKKYKQNEEFEMNENLENILVHAWNKDAVNLRSALDAEMQSRISDHVDSMVADVSARLFNPALSNEENNIEEATWHQSKSKVRMGHPTSWSVVTDPPNELRSAILHKTEKDANDYLENLKKNNPKDHKYSYILKPRG